MEVIRRRRSWALGLGVALGWALVTACGSAVAQDAKVDAVVQQFMRQTHTPGAAVAIVRDGRVALLRGYGIANADYGIPVTAATRFQMASGSKLYTVALLQKLTREGRLRLDDPTSRYVPDAPPAWQKITLLDLARHVSGLAAPEVDTNLTASADVAALAVKVPPQAPPGERASYGDFDYPLLQLAIEKAGGKPFAQLMSEQLFTPLGFHCSGFDEMEEHGSQRMSRTMPDRAEYYRWMGDFNQKREFLYTRWAYGAGGAYSCISDVATFFAALDAGRLLSPAEVAFARTPLRLADGTVSQFGLGWVVGRYRGHAWMGHSGGPAFSDMVYFPEDHVAVLVLTNQQNLYPALAMLIADAVLPHLVDADPPALPDAAPALTAAARNLIAGMAAGHVDPQWLSPDHRGDYLQDLLDFAPGWLAPLQPLTRLELTRDVALPGGQRERSYRVWFGPHPQTVDFGFDADGGIRDFDPRSE